MTTIETAPVSPSAAAVAAFIPTTALTIESPTGIFAGHPLQRYLNDALVVAQHAFMNDGTWQSGGQALLGMQTPPGYP
jgi:hypothetical protein